PFGGAPLHDRGLPPSSVASCHESVHFVGSVPGLSEPSSSKNATTSMRPLRPVGAVLEARRVPFGGGPFLPSKVATKLELVSGGVPWMLASLVHESARSGPPLALDAAGGIV